MINPMSDTLAKLSENPMYFEQIPDSEKTVELALLTIAMDPESLRIIPDKYQTFAVCRAALKKNPLVLKYIITPIIKYYEIAMLNTHNALDLHDILADVKSLDLIKKKEQVFNTIICLAIESDFKTWLEKFPRWGWTIPFINTISRFLVFPHINKNSVALAEFILESHSSNHQEFKKTRKLLLDIVILEKPKSPVLTLTEMRWYLQHVKSFRYDILHQNWSNSLNLTFTNVYNSKDRLLALYLCKDPTEEIIMLNAMSDPWATLIYCLKMNILTGKLLTNLCRYGEKIIAKNLLSGPKYPLDKITNLQQIFDHSHFETLTKMDLTIEQLNDIQRTNLLLYSYLKTNSTSIVSKVQSYDRAIIIDILNKKNYETTDWNPDTELDSLTKEYNEEIVMSFKPKWDGETLGQKKDSFKFHKNGTSIKKVIVLN